MSTEFYNTICGMVSNNGATFPNSVFETKIFIFGMYIISSYLHFEFLSFFLFYAKFM